MAVGLTTIVTSVIEHLFAWTVTGEIRKQSEQQPTHLFVDCSNGVDRNLRTLAEQSMDDFMRRIQRFPVVTMALRLLDYGAQYDPRLKKLDIQTRPYAADWLNLLGAVLHERREESRLILFNFEQKAAELADRLQGEYPETAEMLRNDDAEPSPVWRLAEALSHLQGRDNTQRNLIKLIDAVLLVNRPNGLAMKRGPKKRDVRSLVFTDSVLDYLVHLHVLRTGNKSGYRRLSFKEFVALLHQRYGFCIDQPPPGMTISNELLRFNRLTLERRLRDLGLLIGVNDAESMKLLRPRFQNLEEIQN
jgi:hypothetical protein